tara:strand:- start:169 stop:558 length:390 start_codon:yes stop_codon:yes gene_type:complete
MPKKKTDYIPKTSHKCVDKDWSGGVPKHLQQQTREIGYHNKNQRVNSDYVFNQKDYKKNTKGYDRLTGEIDKRGRPADNQQEIFVKKPQPDKTFAQIKKEKVKNDNKKREALNKKLYKDRLKTKWDRGW